MYILNSSLYFSRVHRLTSGPNKVVGSHNLEASLLTASTELIKREKFVLRELKSKARTEILRDFFCAFTVYMY